MGMRLGIKEVDHPATEWTQRKHNSKWGKSGPPDTNNGDKLKECTRGNGMKLGPQEMRWEWYGNRH